MLLKRLVAICQRLSLASNALEEHRGCFYVWDRKAGRGKEANKEKAKPNQAKAATRDVCHQNCKKQERSQFSSRERKEGTQVQGSVSRSSGEEQKNLEMS